MSPDSEPSSSAPAPAAASPRLLSCNVGVWGKVWRIALGTTLAGASALAIAASPSTVDVLPGLVGIFGGSFMVFEGTFSWCVLRAIARSPRAASAD